ncbi:MAG TPA: glycosyltransferase [Anaerolineae bacterium]|nr:glycosyltransferase [Anaerolineae bacterium]
MKKENAQEIRSASISIIIAVRDGEKTIGRCLEALARQTVSLDDSELIVVDDGSRDRTADIARDHGAIVVAHQTSRGPAASRNTGASRAQGMILLFIDADCNASPEWVSEMLRPFEDPAVCAVHGAYRSRQSGRVSQFAQAEFDERYEHLARRETIDFLATHAAAIREPIFDELGGFRTDMLGNEDVEMAFRLSEHGHKVVFAPRAVVYHEHPSTLLNYLRIKVSRGYWRTIAYGRHPHKIVEDAYTPFWLKSQVVAVLLCAITALGTAFRPQVLPVLVLLCGALLLTTVPFARFVRRVHPELFPLAPCLSLARSAALAFGVLAGLPVAMLNCLRSFLGTLRS